MNHVVLVHPAIPQNTGNIMRTCAATHTPLHIIKPTGFKLNDPRMKRAVMDYFDHLTFKVYENFEEFEKENPGIYHFLTRYSKKVYSEDDFKQEYRNDNGYDLFRRKRNPQKAEICGSDDKHPSDLEDAAEEQKQIAPSVCNHPCYTEAYQKMRIEKKADNLF